MSWSARIDCMMSVVSMYVLVGLPCIFCPDKQRKGPTGFCRFNVVSKGFVKLNEPNWVFQLYFFQMDHGAKEVKDNVHILNLLSIVILLLSIVPSSISMEYKWNTSEVNSFCRDNLPTYHFHLVRTLLFAMVPETSTSGEPIKNFSVSRCLRSNLWITYENFSHIVKHIAAIIVKHIDQIRVENRWAVEPFVVKLCVETPSRT